ncbi:hypothetical protein EUZ85_12560 [Hahella sp. KA22]|uniref:hypothetical protein n=1 Tax=Hahella sp. KA22 TaxID=1628392 RepID=UPI000FDE61B3|nr:hypothetical protein [Hahella sp. KA22]AZZ91518.1 hypothetical protein ENC22_10000 [Hahella sp. KA22]QAY54887.1 hypothetical protein EUZ85_12560 [Hahella sp. KA22]
MKSKSFAGFASILSACVRNKSLPIFTGIFFLTTLVTGCGGGGGSSQSSSGANGVYVFWDAPVTREDGTPLAASEISSYRIYHSFTPPKASGSNKAASNDEWKSVKVPADTDSYYFDNLEVGDHYFAVTAVDTFGVESDPSQILPKTIH